MILTALTWASVIVLLSLGVVGVAVYTRAVAHGKREYMHVIGAFGYVLATQALILASMDNDTERAIFLLINVLGIAAFAALVGRFKGS